MSRRIGQKGSVFQKGRSKATPWNPAAPAYGRYWQDIPGQERQRRVIALGICRTESLAKQKLFTHLETTGVNSKQNFVANTAPATTFRAQAARWIESLSTRRRRPVKPATIRGYQSYLDRWLLPNLGDRLLADISNLALKELVDKMTAASLSPKSIVNSCAVVKLVVASAVNEEGDQLYPRKWNHDFCGIPIVNPNRQRRPTVTGKELEGILSHAKPRYRVLYALLAGTGLRIGEALAIRVGEPTDGHTTISADGRVIQVRKSVWEQCEQQPKTESAIRHVDVPEPLAAVLREAQRGKAGFLFSTQTGLPLSQRNILRDSLHPTLAAIGKGKAGFHCFRRFRITVLRKAGVPENLLRFWVGHERRNLTDQYAEQILQDGQYRQGWAEKAGLGFALIGQLGQPQVVEINSAKGA